jgi:IclR family mhp operon transcriptional activator
MQAKVDPLSEPGPTPGAAPDSSRPASRLVREPSRPIRALSRGLRMLAELNRLQRASIHALASAVRLPRTTAYRILETLRLAGYVERDPHDDCYRPTLLVRALSNGFGDEALVAQIAKPHLTALCGQIVWPVELATPAGTAMLIREATDHQSPLALEPGRTGRRLSILTSAAGRAYLTYTSATRREALLELLTQSPQPEDRLARNRPEIERLIGQTRSQGFGMAQRARRVSDETTLAIPLRLADQVIATLGVRFAATALPLQTAIEQFLPKMRDVAANIEAEFAKVRSDQS